MLREFVVGARESLQTGSCRASASDMLRMSSLQRVIAMTMAYKSARDDQPRCRHAAPDMLPLFVRYAR